MDYKKKLTAQRDHLSQSLDIFEAVELDRDRIIQSSALRRLQQKTQVYPLEPNAAVRSRLTHSLEVQQVGRNICKKIISNLKQQNKLEAVGLSGLEEVFISLVEMACIVHDIGNPPFGHFGEATISSWMKNNALDCFRISVGESFKISDFFKTTLLTDLYCFEGNAQGLRILHTLQELNLTYSQYATLLKYTRCAYQPSRSSNEALSYHFRKPGYYYAEKDIVQNMAKNLDIVFGHRHPLVYIMEAADDISYCIADLEDGMDKNIFSVQSLCTRLIEEWNSRTSSSNYLPNLLKEASENSDANHGFMSIFRVQLTQDISVHAAKRYLEFHDAIFNGSFNEALIGESSEQGIALATLKEVACKFIFRASEIEVLQLRGFSAFTGLFNIYQSLLEMPKNEFEKLLSTGRSDIYFLEQRLLNRIPKRHLAAYFKSIANSGDISLNEKIEIEWYYRCRLFLDYLSGMTDNFVLEAFQKLSAI